MHPINKKYFGNRNIGTTGTADNKIGGEGLASISNPAGGVGSFVVSNTYKQFPRLVIAPPALPGGVQATADVVFEIDTATFSSGGQTNADYVAGLSTSITGLGGGAIVNITEVASKVTAVDVTAPGTSRGEFRRGDAFDGTGITTFQVLQAPNLGTDLQINITFRVKSITILEKGSGYTALPSLSWNGHDFTGQTSPNLNTPVLTTDSGKAGSATNQENAIIIRAKTTTGGSALVGDIIKQVNDRAYKVKTADGTKQKCILVATDTLAVGQAYIKATDSNGNTYFVTKLTGHVATVVQWTQSGSNAWKFATGGRAKWTFNLSPDADQVTIENA